MSDEETDFDDYLDHTMWVILVCPQEKRWIVSQVTPGAEVGQYEIDMSRIGKDWIVGALFDSNVKKILDAVTVLGGSSCLDDLLSGVCRSFWEAQSNLQKWISDPPKYF